MGLPKMTAFAATLLLIKPIAEQASRWQLKQPVLPRYPISKRGKSGVARAKRAARKRK